MAILLQRAALQALSDLVQASVEPVLSTDELLRLLRHAQVADADGNPPDLYETRAASIAYGIGERVVPVARNGYVYRVAAAGVSALTPPAFPTTIGQTVSDGGVTWRCDDEAAWLPSYDTYRLNAAAAAGWDMKAGKLSNNETYSADGASFHPEERRDFCRKQAAVFRNKLAGTLTVASPAWSASPWCGDRNIIN